MLIISAQVISSMKRILATLFLNAFDIIIGSLHIWLSIWNDDGKFSFFGMYVFNICLRLLYVVFRFRKFNVAVLGFGVTNYLVQYVPVLLRFLLK